MRRILFLDTNNDARSIMAEGFANALHIPDLEIVSAGIVTSDVDPMTIKVMGESGIDVSKVESKAFEKLDDKRFDIVITISTKAAECNQILLGHPQKIDWSLSAPTAMKGDAELIQTTFRNTRDHIKQLVDDFFNNGYFQALCSALRCESLILDNVAEGIIVHDLNRKITVFNKSAQALTGYAWSEVVGRDCHDVFPGYLCGGKCLFPDGPQAIKEQSCQELTMVQKSGEEIIVDRTVRSMVDSDGVEVGALIILCDKTHEKSLERTVGQVRSFAGIIGQDEKMLEMFDLISDLAHSDVSVLIQGASGTGKELVAAAIHNEGPRANKLFVPVNCGALPETLLESELFGHVKGSFTGAVRDKKGRFELADGGTIFLDEIGDISAAMQVKLLRVLQEGCFEKVGGEETVHVDVRVVSATNKNLSEEIANGLFREDLYYRLNVVPVWLPPLCERRNDIPLLAEYILAQTLQSSSRSDNVEISDEALGIMMTYNWPGNVR
ncbi:MAG: sigma 54-interacting transcriptional regulator, partial [Kiritimatiellae bacterium]|nr:sigma 54-interacting transcriptional regulator [Kiritimatiellia bacterium]